MPPDYIALAEVRLWAESGIARQIRERARLSEAEVAAPIGVTVPTVSRWERGLRIPRGQAALRYHALLKSLDKHAQESLA
jgi:DNA-binding transcriptional regulator YiaG